MIKSSKRASEIINELLSLSRKRESKFEIIDLNESIKNIMKICETTFDKSIQLKPEYTITPAYISADPTQIEQVLLNLCLNSSHAMTIMKDSREKWGGVLHIAIQRFIADEIFHSYHPESVSNDYWLLSISDTGIGIKPESLSSIFDPFFTTKDKHTGTGLGLAIVYSIIKSHNGFVTVYSEPGNGATFNIYLPRIDKSSDDSFKTIEKNEVCSGEGTILVADDESDVRSITKEFLEECGYNVLLAENGKECLDIFIQNQAEIDAVILDMSMPYMSGKETYIALKEISSDIKIIVITGYKDDQRIAEIINLGVNGVLQKPVDIYSLSEELHKLLKVKD